MLLSCSSRAAVACLVGLACLTTAFAPAPFPRPRRGQAEGVISLPAFQGRWRVVSMKQCSADGNHRPYAWAVTHVRVKDDTWSFEYGNGTAATGYRITIDNAREPAHLDFWNTNVKEQTPPGMGVIRKRGRVVEIIYIFGGNNRPASFARPPEGQYLLVLERVE
jgi:uncharacterized protein (TIGR03067 family)